MSKPNRESYDVAGGYIRAAKWRVDPTAGLVYNSDGTAFARTNQSGYVVIAFRDSIDRSRHRSVMAHRVIWEYVHGELAVELTINHLNGVKADNRIVNLEAATPQQNMQHAYRTGLNVGRRGEDASQSKLTDVEVSAIYRRVWAGELQTHLAVEFGISREVISNIKLGRAWTHITGHVAAFATGPSRSNARLSSDQAVEIYRRCHSGERDDALAAEYGVKRSAVNNIRNGWSWQQFTGHKHSA